MEYGSGSAKQREVEEDIALVCQREATERIYIWSARQSRIWSLIFYLFFFSSYFLLYSYSSSIPISLLIIYSNLFRYAPGARMVVLNLFDLKNCHHRVQLEVWKEREEWSGRCFIDSAVPSFAPPIVQRNYSAYPSSLDAYGLGVLLFLG